MNTAVSHSGRGRRSSAAPDLRPGVFSTLGHFVLLLKRGLAVQVVESRDQTYKVGHITFIVTPVYRNGQGETIFDILLKLMKADAGNK